MSKTRRDFFKNILATTVVVQAAASVPARATDEDTVHGEADQAPADFKQHVVVRYAIPAGKTSFEAMDDMKTLPHRQKSRQIIRSLTEQGLVSDYTISRITETHLEYHLYFRDQRSYQQYRDLMSREDLLNGKASSNQGYSISWELV